MDTFILMTMNYSALLQTYAVKKASRLYKDLATEKQRNKNRLKKWQPSGRSNKNMMPT